MNDSKSCRPVKSTTSEVAALTKSPIGSWVVSSIVVDVEQLEEDHQADREHGVVGGADVGDVVVHLVGHQPELLEDQAAWGPCARPCEPPSEACQENVCSHSPGRGMNSVGPYSIRRWTALVPSLLL